MSHCPPVATAIVLVMLTVATAQLCAQPATSDAVAATPQESTAEIVIPDEPRTIDPATLVSLRLAQPATIEFNDASLNEVIQWLRDEQQISTVAEEQRLENAGISLGEPITDRLNNEPLYLLLNRLRSAGVAWSWREEVLRLVPANDLDQQLQTQPYPVGDLFDAGYDPSDLQDVIEECTLLDWEARDGIGGKLETLGDVLFVRQTEQGHRVVAGLLQALRGHGRRTFTFDEPEHFALREQLAADVTIDAQDVPLVEVLADLSRQTGSEIRIDAAALRELKVRDREPVSVTLSEQPLSVVLRAILSPLKLNWIIRDGVLWATSDEVAGETLKTAVFDVRDLCRDKDESGALLNAVLEYAEGPWTSIDGVGGTLDFAKPGVMVVLQTEGQLDEILQLLEAYRAALRQSKRRERPGEGPDAIITRYYRLQTRIADDLARALPTLIKPESWKNQDRPDAQGTVRQLASGATLLDAGGKAPVAGKSNDSKESSALIVEHAVLIIQQSRAAHAEIEELIRKIENGDPPENAGGPHGGGGGFGGGGFGGGLFSSPDSTTD